MFCYIYKKSFAMYERNDFLKNESSRVVLSYKTNL